jgi:hypothetical protein
MPPSAHLPALRLASSYREDPEERRRKGERRRREGEKAETPLGSKPPPHPRDKRGATREARRADRGGEEETSPWVTPGPGQMSARRRWSKRSGREWRGIQVVACSAFGLPTVDSGSRGQGRLLRGGWAPQGGARVQRDWGSLAACPQKAGRGRESTSLVAPSAVP